jgi:hypothetical protein
MAPWSDVVTGAGDDTASHPSTRRRNKTVKWHLAAALCAALALSACGGGDDKPATGSDNGGDVGSDPPPQPNPIPDPEPDPEPTPDPVPEPDEDRPPPVPTAKGSKIGAAASKIIGAAGGQLATADGAVSVEVPAGAFAQDRTVSIQEISNEAHGGKGRAFRISPEGLDTPVPMTVRFAYTDEDLNGTTLDSLSIAFQDEARLWHVYKEPTVDPAQKTLSIQTTHFSDWSMVAEAQLMPHTARVQVGQPLQLQVMHCERYEEELFIDLIAYCDPSPLDAYSSSHWAVNGVEGGGAQFGSIVADADRWSGKATFTAPATKPTPNVVSVSVQHALGPDPAFQLLVSNITIVEELSCQSLRTVERLDAALAFDEFGFSASRESHSYTGRHSGLLEGTLVKALPDGAQLPFDVWFTYLEPLHGGHVSIADRHVFTPPSGDGFVETLSGSGDPHDAMDVPSFISLKVNYETCTYDLFGSFVVDGTFTHDGNSTTGPIGIGAVYLFNQSMLPEQASIGLIEGYRDVSVITDNRHTGYLPREISSDWQTTGSTRAYWKITPVQ